jgi:hypothetical protein
MLFETARKKIASMDRGAKIHLLQGTLGHSDISTTGRHLHACPDESSALYLGSWRPPHLPAKAGNR